MSSDAKPNSRFLRFSLRTAFLFVTASSTLAGWTVHEARQQGRAVKELGEIGCSFVFELCGPLTFEERFAAYWARSSRET